MRLTHDPWLWLLLLPAALVVLVLFARRGRAEPVSSTLLWRGLDAPPSAARHLRLLPSDLLPLAIAVLLLVLLAFAAATPWRAGSDSPNAFVVVVDASASMGAQDAPGGPSRLDLARRRALALLHAERASRERTLVLTGERPLVVRAGPGSDAPFARALEAVRAARTDTDRLAGLLDAAIMRVQAAGGGRVALIGDFSGPAASVRPRDAEGVAVESHVVGVPVANRAVVSLHVAARPGTPGITDFFFTVVNASDEPATMQLVARADGSELQRWAVRLGAGERRSGVQPVRHAGDGLLSLRVADGGSVAHDDARHARPRAAAFRVSRRGAPPPPRVAAAIDAVLRAAPGDDRDAVTILLLGGVPPGDATAPWLYVARPPGADTASTAPRVVVEWSPHGERPVDPSLQLFVDPADLPPERPPDGAIPVAFAGGEIVLAIVDDGTARGVWCGVPLERLAPPGDASLPLLVAALFDWLASGTTGDGDGGTSEHADLTPRPPGDAHRVTSETGPAEPGPIPLRGALLWVAAGLLIAEAARRLSLARPGRPTVSIGGGRAAPIPRAAMTAAAGKRR